MKPQGATEQDWAGRTGWFLTALLAAALGLIAAIGSPGTTEGATQWRLSGPGPPHRVTVWAVGDGAAPDGKGELVARMLEHRRLQRFLYLGDVYEAGTAGDFDLNYRPTFGRLASRTAPTPGNHEWPNRSIGYRPYWRGVHGAKPPDYYALSIGGWQLLSLNSETNHRRGSPQVSWLRRKIARTPGFGTCRIAFWHEPRFSVVGHAPAPDIAPLWSALRGHARLILNGHSHNYQRFLPRHGLTEVIAGTGGRRIYGEPVPAGHPGLARAHFRYGAIRLRLRRGLADLAFIAVGGRTLDRNRVPCTGGGNR